MADSTPATVAATARKAAEWRQRLEAEIVAAYRSDEAVSLAQLAEASGMTDEGVRKLLKRHDVPLRGRGRRAASAAP